MRIGVFLLATVISAAASAADPAAEIVQAWQQRQPVPVLSTRGMALTMAQAYAVQKQAVDTQLNGKRPAGFKGGLTSPGAQQKFGVNEPVAGVLWPRSGIDASAGPVTVRRANFIAPHLEVELAFQVGTAIERPLTTVTELRAHIDAVMPALELPDLGFTEPGRLTGPDIVAANVGAKRFVLGIEQHPEDVDVNAVSVHLQRDGEEIQTAEAIAVLGNQWRALLWLVNRSLQSGWTLEPGQILITGAMGPMLPLERGDYVADFGELGVLELTVE